MKASPIWVVYALATAFLVVSVRLLVESYGIAPAEPNLPLAEVKSEPTHWVDPLWWFRVDERMCFNCTGACDRSAHMVCGMDTRCLRAHDYACDLACSSCRRFLATRSALDLACEVWPGDVCDSEEM